MTALARQPVELAERAAWQVQTLRVTVFPSPDLEVNPESWWERAAGIASEGSSTERRTGTYEEHGPFGAAPNARLALRVQPGRIDWMVGAAESATVPTFGTIGEFEVLSEAFLETIRRWQPLAPGALRVAFGSVLLSEVPDHQSGYRRLAELLPSVRLDPDSSDFLYRINRPRRSRVVEGLRINRMSTWALLRLTYGGLTPDSRGIRLTRASNQYAAHVEVDVNTAADYEGYFAAERLPAVLDELGTFAREIAREGDVP